jgi:hypothetical protein
MTTAAMTAVTIAGTIGGRSLIKAAIAANIRRISKQQKPCRPEENERGGRVFFFRVPNENGDRHRFL